MKTHKNTNFLFTAVVLIVAVISTNAQTADPAAKRLRYITGANTPVEITANASAAPKRSVELEKSEISDSEDSGFLEREAFNLINLKRLELGLPELIWNDKLAKLAREHSRNMATNGFFSHVGINGTYVDSRAEELGIKKWSAIGENIAFSKGFDNPSSFAVERWMLSDGHRRNLLDKKWQESGLGVAITKDGKYFFTQVFMLR